MRRLAAGGMITVVGALAAGVIGWVRTKGLAVTLGPSDFGLYGQTWAFALYAGQLGGLGVGVAATKLIAERRQAGDPAGLTNLAGLSIVIPGVAGLAVLVVALLCVVPLAHALLGPHHLTLMIIAAASIPFVALQTPLQHVLQGFEDAWGQTVAYSAYSAIFTVFSIGGALLWGVSGAVVGLLLGNVSLLALYGVRQRRLLLRAGATAKSLTRRGTEQLRTGEARELLRVGAASLVIGASAGVADLAVRSVLRGSWGNAIAGLWFGLLLISVQFNGTVSGALSYLTGPMVARAVACQDAAQSRRVIDDSVRLALCVMVPILAFIVVLRRPLVTLLFSADFAAMSRQIPIMLTGDLVRTIGWTVGVALVPLGMTRAWWIVGVGGSIVFGVVGSLAGHVFGLEGAAVGWLAFWVVSTVATVAVLVHRRAWAPSRRSAFGAALAFATVLAGGVLPLDLSAPVVICLLAAMLIAITRPAERSAFMGLVRGPLASWAGRHG